MSKPLSFSILTPTLNGLRFLPDAVNSVRQQRNIGTVQHIIMDGGSTDGSIEWLRANANENTVWRSEPDRGQSDALNKALSLATGDIIGWINADDRFLPEAFERAQVAFEQNPHVDVVYGDYRLVDVNGNPFEELRTREWGFESLVLCGISGALVGQPATFWRRRLNETIGNLDVNLHYCMDWDFWIRARQVGPFAHVDGFLADFRVHGAAKTADDLTHMDEVMDMCDRYVAKLPSYRRAPVQKMLDERRAAQRRQQSALDDVLSAVRQRLDQAGTRRLRLVLYAMGNNGRRLYRKLGELIRGRNVEVLLLDDSVKPNALTPDGVMRSEQVTLKAGAQFVIVTPWEDAAIINKLEAAGLEQGTDYIRWSAPHESPLIAL